VIRAVSQSRFETNDFLPKEEKKERGKTLKDLWGETLKDVLGHALSILRNILLL